MDNKIKFNSIQISDFAMTMENHGVNIDFSSDAQASIMFSDLLIEMAQSLDKDQVNIFHQAI